MGIDIFNLLLMKDKATVEMECMEEGYLAKIIRGDGSKEIKVGEVYSYNKFQYFLPFIGGEFDMPQSTTIFGKFLWLYSPKLYCHKEGAVLVT